MSGRLDARRQRRVANRMWRAVQRHDRQVVVDVSRVSYFDSTALWNLLGIEALAERQFGCAVDLRGVEEATLALTGLRPLT